MRGTRCRPAITAPWYIGIVLGVPCRQSRKQQFSPTERNFGFLHWAHQYIHRRRAFPRPRCIYAALFLARAIVHITTGPARTTIPHVKHITHTTIQSPSAPRAPSASNTNGGHSRGRRRRRNRLYVSSRPVPHRLERGRVSLMTATEPGHRERNSQGLVRLPHRAGGRKKKKGPQGARKR